MGASLDDLLRQHYSLRKLSDFIGESLADNYRKGLNGDYARRLAEGVRVATKTAAEDLPSVAQALIEDRGRKGVKTVPDLSQLQSSEMQLRAMILGLWSVRPVRIGRGGRIELEILSGEFSIRNSGGPLAVDPAKLFSRFTRDASKSGNFGLGLSLVQKICDYYGLAVSYRNEDEMHIFTINLS